MALKNKALTKEESKELVLTYFKRQKAESPFIIEAVDELIFFSEKVIEMGGNLSGEKPLIALFLYQFNLNYQLR